MKRSSRHLLILTLAVGLGTLLAIPSPAADKVSPEQINKLIEKMGSGNFEEREQANDQLDKLGEAALDALRKAAKSDDPEVRKRAEELVAKIEKRGESARLLVPKRLRLTYKDTPVAEAVKDFAKKSGYTLGLHDPENKLKGRKLSLDTGEVTFWQAFDLFCREAGLVEMTQEEMLQEQLQKLQPGANPFGGPGGIRIQPAPRIRVVPGTLPEDPKNAKPKGPLNFQEAPAEAPAQPAQPAQPAPRPRPVQAVPAVPPGAVVPPGGIQIGFGGGVGMLGALGGAPGFPQLPNDQITLKVGKPEKVPTDYSTAVRVRTSDHVKQFGNPPDNEIRLGLQLSPEPKLQMQMITTVRVDKAIDDKDQKLSPIVNAGPNLGQPGLPPGIGGIGGFPGGAGALGFGGFGGFNFVGGGAHHYTMIQLKKGEKAAKTLKELTGVVTAQVLQPPVPAITADNILKAAGKTFKGKDGGFIKVLEVTRNAKTNQVTVRFEFEPPANGQPANGPFGVPNIQIFPGQPPVPPQPRGQAPRQGAVQVAQLQAVQVQVQAAPAQAVPVQIQAVPARVQIAPGQVQIQVQIGGVGGVGGAIAPWGGVNVLGGNGLTLVDAKGNNLPLAGVNQRFQRKGNAVSVEHVMTFKADKGQEPAKLIYSTQKSTSIDIPFTLKDVTIP